MRLAATYGLAGRTLAVDADDDAVAHILQTTYADARVQNVRAAHHTASVRRLSDGRLHVRFDRRALAVGDPGASVPLLSAYYASKELFARFAVAHPLGLGFYGALVEVGGAAVLILGPTTIGKTIFALHLAWQGARFLGDETAVLDVSSSSISALARRPALREPALEFLPSGEMRDRVSGAAHVLETDRGRFWYALQSDELCGIAPCERAYPLGAVCIIRERACGFALRRIEIAQAMPAIMQRAYARPAQLAELAGLRRAMRHVAQYELTLGEPRTSAIAFLNELRVCA